MKIYLIGYSGFPIDCLEIGVRDLDAILIDIRFNAYSPNPYFLKGALMKRFGDRYQHFPEFGNQNYQGSTVILKDFEAGLKRLMGMSQAVPVIMMCTCKSPSACHRTIVSARLKMSGYFPEELDRSVYLPKDPQGQLF